MPKASTAAPAATPTSTTPLSAVNPLISDRGDITAVSAALQFIAKAFAQVNTDDAMDLSYDEGWGLSCLLRTCAVALDTMNRPDYREGGAE